MDNARLEQLFEQALDIPVAQRAHWLDTHCNDPELRRALERLLAADAIAEGVLEHAPELLADSMADAIEVPQRFGIWRVTGALGAGGMGEVWLAERDDGEFRQRAAIKQVAWPTPGLLQRFRKERQILAALEHPGIARLIDGGMDESGCPWLAMEYVEGVKVTEWVHEQALSVRATVELVLRVCDAVQFAHRNLVVHSDIKPSNILVAEGAPKLLDFGIAKVLAQDGDAGGRTRTEAQLLTPDYAAPELMANSAITTSVDVYSLGVLLYELLCGSRPYRLATLGGAAGLAGVSIKPPSAAVNPALPDVRARKRILGGDLGRLVLHAMAHEPARRYNSVEALASDLRNWRDGRAIAARGDHVWYRFGKFVRRNRAAVSATALAFVMLLGATWYSAHQTQLARAQAARANAVRDFVVGVFEQTDPDARQGKPITARELLDMGARQLQDQPHPRPFRTEMQGLLGYLYWEVGDYPRGHSMLQDAVSRPESATPPDVGAHNLLYLAQSELEDNLYPMARSHAAQARALALQGGDAGAATASAALRVEAEGLIDDGNSRAGEPILLRALKNDSSRFGAHSDQVAEDLGDLASATRELGRYDESLGYSKRAIDAETALHSRVSAAVISDLLTLATTELYSGDPASAERDAGEAVQSSTKLYGPTHATTLSMRANLYMIYAHDEKYAQALAGHLDLVRLTQRFAPTRIEQLAYQWDGVAVDYLGLGRYEEAVHAARRSLAAREHMRSPDEYASVDVRTVLAEILMEMGRLDEAEVTFREVIRIEGKNARSDSEQLNRDMACLGNVYRLQHRYAIAVTTTSKALHALSPRIGPTPTRTLIQMYAALALLDAGRIDAARDMAARAQRAGAIAYGRRPLAFSGLQFVTARVALARHEAAAAETWLRAASKARMALPADDPRNVEVRVALIRALEMQGKYVEAKSLRAQVEPLLAASKSPYFADLRQSLNAH